jgi:hypothetical protein
VIDLRISSPQVQQQWVEASFSEYRGSDFDLPDRVRGGGRDRPF